MKLLIINSAGSINLISTNLGQDKELNQAQTLFNNKEAQINNINQQKKSFTV